MKIIKYVFLLILLAFIAIVVFIATQEGRYDIKKERVINVPQPLLYEYINDYRNWENVGILTHNDTTAVFAYSEITAGKGAISTWKRKNSTGKIQTVRVIENDSIIQKAVIDGQPSVISWGFRKAAGGTKVSVRMKGELTFSDKANAVFKGGVSEKLEDVLDKGLESLNTFLVHELKDFTIEVGGVVRKTGTYYLCQSATSSIPDMNKRVTDILPKLMAFIKENKIATNGNPFTIYKTYDKQNNTTSFKVCVPIKEEIFTAPGSEIEGAMLEPFNAFKTSLKGYYSHLPKAWAAAHNAIAEKGLHENTSGQYIEVYSRSVKHTKKPSQWITDIYIPVGPETVPPTVSPDAAQAATSANATGSMVTPAKPAAATTRPAAGNATAKPPVTGTATTKATAPVGTATKPAGTTTATKPKPKPKATTAPATPQRSTNSMDEFQK